MGRRQLGRGRRALRAGGRALGGRGLIDPGVAAFVRANLPEPPARVLEVGAGEGELARALRAAGYDVVAVDPGSSAEGVEPVALADLDADPGSFDAAVSVVALHHVHPLDGSLRRLGAALRPGATLVVDELDVERFDERAAEWWLAQRRALGRSEDSGARELVDRMRGELHTLAEVQAALAGDFEVDRPLRGAYLYRWGLEPSLRPLEEELIARGELPAVGARFSAARR